MEETCAPEEEAVHKERLRWVWRADNIRPYDIALVCSYAFLGEL